MTKTASELGISEKELEALVKTRCLLSERMPDGTGFNMSQSISYDHPGWVDEEKTFEECGTVACIGGWMALSMGMSRKEANDYVAWVNPFNPLSDLFYPVRISPDDWNKITPAQAGRVIDRFLETGRVDWSIT